MRLLVALSLVVGVSAVLVVAAAAEGTVTIRARSTVVRYGEPAVVLGTVSSATANEYVSVEGRVCGAAPTFFRALGGATTSGDGSWTTQFHLPATTTLRADWNGAKSATIEVQARMNVWLLLEAGRFRVGASNDIGGLDRKRVVVQRLTSAGWKTIRVIVLRDNGHADWAEKRGLRFAVPKGTVLRAVMPLTQTKPCYLAGYSKLVRT